MAPHLPISMRSTPHRKAPGTHCHCGPHQQMTSNLNDGLQIPRPLTFFKNAGCKPLKMITDHKVPPPSIQSAKFIKSPFCNSEILQSQSCDAFWSALRFLSLHSFCSGLCVSLLCVTSISFQAIRPRFMPGTSQWKGLSVAGGKMVPLNFAYFHYL